MEAMATTPTKERKQEEKEGYKCGRYGRYARVAIFNLGANEQTEQTKVEAEMKKK